jgi:hypothetical protein
VHTVSKAEGKGEVIDLKGLFALGEDFVRAAAEAPVQAAEMAEAMGAAKGERSGTRLSHHRGYNSRSLITGLARCGCGCRRIGHSIASRRIFWTCPQTAKAHCPLRDPATKPSIGPPRSKRSRHHNALSAGKFCDRSLC